ncbi:GNAT family N-acetyltransferase [Aspergillus melleus]|uniref:GNAT family N-acetyltransferase n=1 Tax=Aspergillus melleus TaxID=138277 RepID=UPI001E8E102E|nr:uncharacterized protein LDX57_000176 [Aspergillus melleus]KAH8422422.1 hypothetical protein LDX57_000176 [Aspergillus melleus]
MTISDIALLPATTLDHETLDALIDRYKTLRLRALKEDPEAFGSKYEDELKFPREKWQARIENPKAHTLIALENTTSPGAPLQASDNSTLSALLSRKWVGTLTMVGPEPVPGSGLGQQELLKLFDSNRSDSCGPEADPSILAYVLNGMYVLRESRRAGNGKRLLEEVVDYARTAGGASGAAQVWLFAFLEVKNRSAVVFYEKCGFRAWEEEVFLHGRYVWMMEFRITP